MTNLSGRIATKIGRETKVTLTYSDPLIDYRISDRDSAGSGGFNYYGYLKTNGSYYIMRETLSTGAYRYIKGTSDYTTNWTNRASLIGYDYFNITFA